MDITQTHRGKKLLYNEVTLGVESNDVTFNNIPNLIVSDTKRNETSSLIDNINNFDQPSNCSPSLNIHNLQQSSGCKFVYTIDKVNSQFEKSDQLDSDNHTHTEKDSPQIQDNSQTAPQYVHRKSNQHRSIFLSPGTRKPLERVKNNVRAILTLRHSQTSTSSKMIDFKLLNQIKKKMVFFQRNFTWSGRNNILKENGIQLRKIINDQGDYVINQNKKLLLKIIRKIINVLMCFRMNKSNNSLSCFMIVPNSLTNLLSLTLFCFLNILFYFLLSVIIIFDGYKMYESTILKFILSAWSVEIIVQLNTQIYKRTNLISDRDKVLAQYISKRAMFDLIPLVVMLLLPQNLITRKIFQGVAFIKLKNVLPDINKMQKLLCMSVKNYYLVQLFNLIFKVLVISHIIACVWYLIGQIELKLLDYEYTWYDKSLGADYSWWKLYLESMYWSLTLMTTGSNIANSIPQMLFTSVVMLFTTIIFGYMLNTTGIILSQLDEKDEKKRADLNILNEYMRQNKISKSLQGRVNLDLEYYFLHNLKQDSEQKQEVMKKISPNLQNLLKMEYCKQASKNFDFIFKKFSKDTINDMILEFQEEFYAPNQMIFVENQVSDLSLICVVQGSVEVMHSYQSNQKSKKQVQILKDGDLVGQINFFTGLEYEYSVRSLEFTKVLKLSRDKFIEIIQKRSKDYETFCKIRDQQQFYQDYQSLQYECSFCQNPTHLSTECNLIHFEKQNIKFKVKFQQNYMQSRQKHNRKEDGVNSYLIRKEIEKQIKKFAWDLKQQTNNKKFKHLMSGDSYHYIESDNSLPEASTYQMFSSQSSDNSDCGQSVNEAQTVKNQSYFDQNNQLKCMNVNQHKIKKRNEQTEKEAANQLITQQNNEQRLQAEFLSKYQNLAVKRNSIMGVDPILKRNSIMVYDPSAKRNSIMVFDPSQKRNSIQVNDSNIIKNSIDTQHTQQTQHKRYSVSIDDSNQLKYLRNLQNPLNNENKYHIQTNSIGAKENCNSPTPQTYDKSKILNLTNIEKLQSSKRGEQEQKHKHNQNQEKKPHFLVKQTSFLPIQEDEYKDKKKPLFIFDFDQIKSWAYYFPSGNIKSVLSRYSKFIRKRSKQLKINLEKRLKDKKQKI